MDENIQNKIERYKNDDEIDLVDILSVLIKRKWLIIILLIISVIISLGYVKLHKSKISYSTNYNITLPDELILSSNYTINKVDSDTDIFINKLKKELNKDESEKDFQFNITTDPKTKNINVKITSNNIEDAKDLALLTYKIYSQYKNQLISKNNKLLEITKTSLEQDLKQKQAILNMLMKDLKKNSSIVKNEAVNGSIVYLIDYVNNGISNIKRIIASMDEVIYDKGKIEITNDSKSLIIDDNSIDKISDYIKTEAPSKKKRLLPVFISVFLALFVGIFLAFVVEFFSREDVKARLKAASKK